jgi:hypothetical protein|tara:strand:- start:664 stop:849 length:186 start_codon:yes stop_codon:yes gene_type:complete
MKGAADMTVEEFKQYLAQRRDELMNIGPLRQNAGGRPHFTSQKVLFQSSSVKLAMQRRRTK